MALLSLPACDGSLPEFKDPLIQRSGIEQWGSLVFKAARASFPKIGKLNSERLVKNQCHTRRQSYELDSFPLGAGSSRGPGETQRGLNSSFQPRGPENQETTSEG